MMQKKAIAYVDGSYNNKTKQYGSGVVFIDEVQKVSCTHFGGCDASMASMRNVAGEINAAAKAIEKAINGGYTEVQIFYDYEGIGAWADRRWQAKNTNTQHYRDFVANARKYITITFTHVKAHSNQLYNDQADILAKKGAGIIVEENTPPLPITPPPITSQPLIPDGVNPKCKEAILVFFQIKNPSFKDYAALRTYGLDTFSALRAEELMVKIGKEMWEKIREKYPDFKQAVAAAKWHCRGLSIDDALKKVATDAEIAENMRKK